MSNGVKAALGVLGGVIALILLAALVGALGGSGSMMGPGGMMGNRGWWGPGGMMDGGWGLFGGVGGIVPLLFWGALIALVVWAVIRLTSPPSGGARSGEEPAEEILRQRFARGEIDVEEYEERRRVLRREQRPREARDGARAE